VLVTGFSAAIAADWPTARGNGARTGAADNLPGPKAPKVLWVHEGREQFIAAPIPAGKDVIVSGLGAFNTASVYALAVDAPTANRLHWSKIPPFLKLPTVSAPAIAGTHLIFGDGMHQTDGAALHCLNATTGRLSWRYSLPGQLVHIEGAPTIANGRVYFGGGHAGLVCLDLTKLDLDGKEISASDAEKVIEEKWKQLLATFEVEKKKDPDFAIPPSEDALPKPSPKLVWQKGKEQWHIDAPVAVAGDKVLAATAYLEVEKTGERALVCVSAADGSEVWKAPLQYNPWPGPTVHNDLVFVGGSNIRFDPKEIPKGRGEVMALSLTDGKQVWRRDVPGGVVSSVVATDKFVVFTATDGKVRGLDRSTGMRAWTYEAAAPMFAAPAIAGDVVYAADLKGTVHACQLADGKPLWKLSLADAPVKVTGMIVGSPLVIGGKLIVATCDLDGSAGRNVVVCLGD
jgi:outer membrane protein assembly factor BamB